MIEIAGQISWQYNSTRLFFNVNKTRVFRMIFYILPDFIFCTISINFQNDNPKQYN